jgi:hypothetical protein
LRTPADLNVGVFTAKHQRNVKPQNADGRHHSKHGGNTKFTFQNRQNENTNSRTDLGYACGEAYSDEQLPDD